MALLLCWRAFFRICCRGLVIRIVVNGKSLSPAAEDVFTGAYPLAEGVYLWAHPKASAAAKAFAASFAAGGTLSAVLGEAGILPVR